MMSELPIPQGYDVVFHGEICYYRHPAGKPFSPETAVRLREEWDSVDDIPTAFTKLVKKEAQAAKKHKFAWDPEFGYLTPSVAWCGTGLSFYCDVHLEGLSLLGRLNQTLDALNAMRLNCDSFSFQGISHAGHLFSIENAASLGITDRDLCRRVAATLGDLVRQELNARNKLLKDHGSILDDAVERALGILKNARLLSSLETLDLLSPIRLAKSLGFIDGIALDFIHGLMFKFFDDLDDLDDDDEDEEFMDKVRARHIRNLFKNVKINALGKKYLR